MSGIVTSPNRDDAQFRVHPHFVGTICESRTSFGSHFWEPTASQKV